MKERDASLPKLIIFKGLPGTGKSTLAKKLQSVLGWPLIIRDEIKETLIKEGMSLDLIGLRSHQIMWARAVENLSENISCILDTNLNQKIILDDLKDLEKTVSVEILVIECMCSDESVLKARIESRKNKDLFPFWIDSWEKYQEYLKSGKNDGNFDLPYPVLKIDTKKLREQPLRQLPSNSGLILILGDVLH